MGIPLGNDQKPNLLRAEATIQLILPQDILISSYDCNAEAIIQLILPQDIIAMQKQLYNCSRYSCNAEAIIQLILPQDIVAMQRKL